MTVRERIRQYVIDTFLYGAPPGELCDGASFLGAGIMDSTGVMELILFVESEFGVRVEDAEMLPENLDSVDALCRYIAAKTEAKERADAAV